MGILASGVAIYFMESHKLIKKAWKRMGLDVRHPAVTCRPHLWQPCPQGLPPPRFASTVPPALHARRQQWAG